MFFNDLTKMAGIMSGLGEGGVTEIDQLINILFVFPIKCWTLYPLGFHAGGQIVLCQATVPVVAQVPEVRGTSIYMDVEGEGKREENAATPWSFSHGLVFTFPITIYVFLAHFYSPPYGHTKVEEGKKQETRVLPQSSDPSAQ